MKLRSLTTLTTIWNRYSDTLLEAEHERQANYLARP
jgi:hypothetical protein